MIKFLKQVSQILDTDNIVTVDVEALADLLTDYFVYQPAGPQLALPAFQATNLYQGLSLLNDINDYDDVDLMASHQVIKN